MAHAHELHLLTTYENRIRRSVDKNTAELLALQAEPKAAVAKAEKEAEALVRLAQTEGGDYDATDDFPPESQPLRFVFSRPAIERRIERQNRLFRANLPLTKNLLRTAKPAAGDAK
jgi:hypothetical protein